MLLMEQQTQDNTTEQDPISKIGDTVRKRSAGYREGAIAGALAGIIISAYMKKKIWVGGLIGLVAGGYIGYEINKSKNDNDKFVKPKANSNG